MRHVRFRLAGIDPINLEPEGWNLLWLGPTSQQDTLPNNIVSKKKHHLESQIVDIFTQPKGLC